MGRGVTRGRLVSPKSLFSYSSSKISGGICGVTGGRLLKDDDGVASSETVGKTSTGTVPGRELFNRRARSALLSDRAHRGRQRSFLDKGAS